MRDYVENSGKMRWLRVKNRFALLMASFGLVVAFGSVSRAEDVNTSVFIVAATESTNEVLIDSVIDRLRNASFDGRQFTPQPIIVSSNDELTGLINDGVADLAISDARVAIKAMIRNPNTPALKATLPSTDLAAVVFAVRAGSNIQSMADLTGRKLAFEGVWNRSGYFGPVTHLLRGGHPLRYLDTVRAGASPDDINFVFAGDEVNMVAWLHRGLIDALAFNRTDWDNKAETPPHIRDTLRLILDEDIRMDQYVTLISRSAVLRQNVIQEVLFADRNGVVPFRKLLPSEEEDIDFLIDTYGKTEQNYLAHE